MEMETGAKIIGGRGELTALLTQQGAGTQAGSPYGQVGFLLSFLAQKLINIYFQEFLISNIDYEASHLIQDFLFIIYEFE